MPGPNCQRPFPLTPAAQFKFAELHGSADIALQDRRSKWCEPQAGIACKITERVLVINDLHVGAGYDAETGVLDRQDEWQKIQDGQMTTWLAKEWEAAARGRVDIVDKSVSDDMLRCGVVPQDSDPYRLTLTLNGDIIDLLQTNVQKAAFQYPDGLDADGGPLNTPRNNVVQIQMIRSGHPEVFKLFAQHLLRGHHIDFIPGNHDRHMLHPAVWKGFVDLLKQDMADSYIADGDENRHPTVQEIEAAADRIKLKIAGIYGDTWVDHGDMADKENRLKRPYQQVLAPCNDNDCHDESFGDRLVKRGFNHVEPEIPDLDNMAIGGAKCVQTLFTHPRAAWRLLKGAFYAFCTGGYDKSPKDDKAQRIADARRLPERFPEMLQSINATRARNDQLSQAQLVDGLEELEKASAVPFYSQYAKGAGFFRRLFRMAWSSIFGNSDMEGRKPDEVRLDRYAVLHKLGFNHFVEGHTHKAVHRTLICEDGQAITHDNTHTWMKRDGDYGTATETFGSNSRGVGVIMLGTQGEGNAARVWSTTELMRLNHGNGELVKGDVMDEYESPSIARQSSRLARATYERNHPAPEPAEERAVIRHQGIFADFSQVPEPV